MQTLLIVVHLMIVIALVGVVLLQRSEGGGLGIGGGSGFMTARGAANALTRTTAILAAAFFVTSLTLSIVARYGESPTDILDRLPTDAGGAGGGGILDQIGGSPTPSQPTPPSSEAQPTPPSSEAPAATPPSGEAQQPSGPATPPTGEAQPATPPASEPATPPATTQPESTAPTQPAPAQ